MCIYTKYEQYIEQRHRGGKQKTLMSSRYDSFGYCSQTDSDQHPQILEQTTNQSDHGLKHISGPMRLTTLEGNSNAPFRFVTQ